MKLESVVRLDRAGRVKLCLHCHSWGQLYIQIVKTLVVVGSVGNLVTAVEDGVVYSYDDCC